MKGKPGTSRGEPPIAASPGGRRRAAVAGGPVAGPRPPDPRPGPHSSGPGYTVDFFVLRTPLLPWDTLEAWAGGLEAPAFEGRELQAALERDRETLSSRLQRLAQEPVLREALFLGSPDLESSLEVWFADSGSERGRRVGRAVLRYVTRMCARATPFGLFAGHALGITGSRTRLEVPPREASSRHTRLDMDYLLALAETLGREEGIRADLSYRLNSSLYRAAGRIRYVESRLQDKARTHHLVALEPAPYLESTLALAAAGATPSELARPLVDGEVSLEEAEAFVRELTETQILVSGLSPAVTGPEPIHGLVDLLERLPAGRAAAGRLREAGAALQELDREGLGHAPDRYRGIAARLPEPSEKPDLARLFQVDLVKGPSALTLAEEVIAEIARGVETLRSVFGGRGEDPLAAFREAFIRRYEGREVPLAEALDEEVGVGFAASDAPSAEASPLLDGLRFPEASGEERDPWTAPQRALLLRKLDEAVRTGAIEIDLEAGDLRILASPRPGPLPNAYAAMVTLAAPSAGAVDRGEYRVVLEGVTGPSGVRLLGRFCHADPDLRRRVEAHLRAEEALTPGALFAEIVHLPEGRIGNVLCRPVLRKHEIPYLGRSGASEEFQLPLGDLRVRVDGGRVVLRSARLDREILPRMSTAHNFTWQSVGVYRFLCLLQNQDGPAGLGWRWGTLGEAAFLPRVSCGRVVLAPAHWRVEREEMRAIPADGGADSMRAVRRWRARRGLPRWVSLAEADHVLPVDLENVLGVDMLLHLVRERDASILREMFPGPGDLCAAGPEGRFVHELVVPFVRRREPSPAPSRPRDEDAPGGERRRVFFPGSDCLFVALHTGTSTADRLLRRLVRPLVDEALGSGAARRWFFIRYADPEWHLRVRFFGPPARLAAEVLPRLESLAAPLFEEGGLSRLSLLTYEREVERYGGPEGVECAEAMFQEDSVAALEIVETLAGDAGADARWRLALVGMDRLLEDLGLDLEAKLGVVRASRAALGREFEVDKEFEGRLGMRFRGERGSLEALLGASDDEDGELGPGLAALRRRSDRLVPWCRRLRELEREGRLACKRDELAASHLHMHANRLLRSSHRAQELVIYDFLVRLYRSQLARQVR